MCRFRLVREVVLLHALMAGWLFATIALTVLLTLIVVVQHAVALARRAVPAARLTVVETSAPRQELAHAA